jgi:hypothetical protein
VDASVEMRGELATAELYYTLEGLVDDPGVWPDAVYLLSQIAGEE